MVILSNQLLLFPWYSFQQFYHHCANVIIDGKANGRLPELDMTVVDIGKKRNVSAKGDNKVKKSTGPDAKEKRQNTNGFYAFGGGAGKKGIDLGLVYH